MSRAFAIDVVSVCLFYELQLLTLKRSAHRDVYPNAWEVVSGRVRKNEDLAQAATREIAEETSFDLLVCGPPLDVYEAPYGSASMRVHVFAAPAPARDVVLSNEHCAYRWVDFETFASLCPFARLVTAAKMAFAQRST